MTDAKGYESLSISALCGYLRRAEVLAQALPSRELRDAAAAWPSYDFAEIALSVGALGRETVVPPKGTLHASLMFPTDRTTLVRSVAAQGFTVRVLMPPDNVKYVAEATDVADGLWLPVRCREELRFTLTNRDEHPKDAAPVLRILAHVLEPRV